MYQVGLLMGASRCVLVKHSKPIHNVVSVAHTELHTTSLAYVQLSMFTFYTNHSLWPYCVQGPGTMGLHCELGNRMHNNCTDGFAL